MLQVELDSLLLCFCRGRCLLGGPQSSAGAQQRLPHFSRLDRLLFRKSHLTLDVFSLVCFQPLHRALLRSACRCRELPVKVWPHWPLGPQAWWRSSYSSPRRLPCWALESLQRHFVKLVVPVLAHFLFRAFSFEINMLVQKLQSYPAYGPLCGGLMVSSVPFLKRCNLSISLEL